MTKENDAKSADLYVMSGTENMRVGFPLTSLINPHICACPKPRPGFPTLYTK